MTPDQPTEPWYVYLLGCHDNTLYCGITTNLERRLKEHNQGSKGAKYTRARRPVHLVYSQKFPDRSSAARFEYRLKQLGRSEKLQFTAGFSFSDLAKEQPVQQPQPQARAER